MPSRLALFASRRPTLSIFAASLALSFLALADLAPEAAASSVPDLTEQPSLVRVRFAPGQSMATLMEQGFDVIEGRKHECLVLVWPGDAERMTALGNATELVDAQPGRTAAARSRAELSQRPSRQRSSGPSGFSAPPFGSGSLAGFWTLAEVKAQLDDWVANDADDVVAAQVDSIGRTVQNRPVWGLMLGKSVPPPDTRPVAYFNSLTHAREPEGMQALMYFVQDLLSKYGTDATATYLLDNRRIYVVPVVNPDGYLYNESVYTSSGGSSFGFWRKNLRDNNNNFIVDNSDGVDLNRNYSFHWGPGGSSGSMSAGDYRGPSAFSEWETQAQRNKVAELTPNSSISFHTYSDLFIHPYNWTTAATPDSLKFYEWSDDLSLGTGYQAGQGPRLLYPATGEYTDWCYGDITTKPRVWAWTPEVGNPSDDFWPPPSRIIPLAEENLGACYYVASIAGPYPRLERFTIVEGALNAGHLARINVRARNKGILATPGGSLTATLVSLSAGALVTDGNTSYAPLGSLLSGDPLDDGFQVAADDTVTPGRLLMFQMDFAGPDGFLARDTVEVRCGTPTVLLSDDASSGMGNWIPGSWTTENLDPSHPGPYFVDSFNGTYAQSANNSMRLAATLDLSPGVHAVLTCEAKWEFENDYDCGLIEASFDGSNWGRLWGTGASLGKSFGGTVQPSGPVFSGSRHLWAPLESDLSSFADPIGTSVRFRFRVLSDVGAEYDGFKIDEVKILVYDPAAQPEPVAVGDAPGASLLEFAAPRPNPARDRVTFSYAVPEAGTVRLEVFDVQGRRCWAKTQEVSRPDRFVLGWNLRDGGGRVLAPGVYTASLSGSAGRVIRRFAIVR